MTSKQESVRTAGPAENGRDGTRPSLGVLADRPVKEGRDDCLGYDAFADALAELIDHPETDTPLTIAISAPWGAGKTTLARLVEGRLHALRDRRGEPRHITCWFNAWMHDDAPHLGSAFASEVSKNAHKDRRAFHRLVQPLPSALLSPSQRTHRRLYYTLGTLLIIAMMTLALIPWYKKASESQSSGPSVPQPSGPPDKIQETFSLIQYTFSLKGISLFLAIVIALFMFFTKFFSVAQAVAGFVKDPAKEAATGSMREVSRQLGSLLREVTNSKRRFVIFVDDLERCKPPRSVEVCEVATQLLSHPDVVTVLIADMASVAACADVKYGPLEGRYPITGTSRTGRGSDGETYGQMYLQKIVQIQFDLPVPSTDAIQLLAHSSPIHEAPHELQGGREPEVGSAEKAQVSELAPTSRQERIIDVVSRLGWKIALGLSAGLLILGAILQSIHPVSSVDNILLVLFSISLFIAVPVFALTRIVLHVKRFLRRRMAKRNTKAVDERIRESAKSDDVDVGQLVARIRSQSGRTDDRLLEQRVQRYLIGSQLRQQADDALLPFLPPLPRAAKRQLNLMRVLLAVAVRRGMLGGHPELTVQHLAKWAALMSRWPELGATLRAAPEEIAVLEGTADIGELTDRLRELNYSRPITEDLFVALHSSTKLAPVMTRLVTYESVPEDENVPCVDLARVAGGIGESEQPSR